MSYKSLRNCLIYSFLIGGLLVFQGAGAQFSRTDLDNIVNDKSKALKTDVVLIVANKDTTVYQKDSKLFSALRGQAPIGSSSQWLTTAVILQLVDEGKISLDDRVAAYLPVFEKYGKNYITIRHCLTHQMGIQTEVKLKLLSKKKFASLDEEASQYAMREIQTNAGTEYRYNEAGFVIAARIAEIVTKKKFDMLAQQKLFRPMAMRQTTFGTMDGSVIDPANGARSTANDYIRFLRMLLNGGTLNGQRILSAESVAEFRKISGTATALKAAPKGVEGMSYALGVWAPETTGGGAAAMLVEPSFGGTVPVVDFCRGYAFMFLVKELNETPHMDIYSAIKGELDNAYPTTCK